MHSIKVVLILQVLFFWLLASFTSAQTLYTKPCPFLDLNYPALSSYASSSVIQSALNTLNNSVTEALNQTTVYGQLDSQSNAFGIDIYSLYEEEPIFTYYYTPEELIAMHSVGVETVDSDSVYRIASVSKLLTVYIYLITVGDGNWNQPVTQYVPELAAYAQMYQNALQDDMIDIVDWDSVTIGALASQMADIAREEAYSPSFEQALESLGLPPPTRNASEFCGDASFSLPCDREAFFDDFLKQHPIAVPFTTPFYSNVAFQILGYALENITGSTLPDLFNEALVQRLDLNSTYYTVPPSPNTSFVPINTTFSLWNVDARGETPTGGYFSSIKDMRKIGKSILNSTLLTPAQTRRWMKPHSFTANLNLSIGAPWEIVRSPAEPVSWIYTKTGDFGAYSNIVALLPEYKMGITVIGAGFSTTDTVRILSDMVVDIIAPAAYEATKAAAADAYVGTYSSFDTNSTITLSLPDSGPGLMILEWTLNGTQFLSNLASLLGVNQTTQTLNITMYPSGLTSNNGTKVSWRALLRVNPQQLDPGAFSGNCVSWGSGNTLTYSGVGFDEYVFGLDSNGTAISIEPRVLALEYMRAAGMMTSVSPRWEPRQDNYKKVALAGDLDR